MIHPHAEELVAHRPPQTCGSCGMVVSDYRCVSMRGDVECADCIKQREEQDKAKVARMNSLKNQPVTVPRSNRVLPYNDYKDL